MNLTVVLDKFTHDLQLIIRPNVEICLHTLDNRLIEILRVHLEHDLEWEPLEDGQFTAEIVRMLIDWQPDLHSIVSVLPIDLIQIETVVHRLLYSLDVVIVTDIEPVV